MFAWMSLLGVVAALALYPSRSYYEPFHAYATNKTFINCAYGLFMVTLQGVSCAALSAPGRLNRSAMP